jgi:hypothetical protein
LRTLYSYKPFHYFLPQAKTKDKFFVFFPIKHCILSPVMWSYLVEMFGFCGRYLVSVPMRPPKLFIGLPFCKLVFRKILHGHMTTESASVCLVKTQKPRTSNESAFLVSNTPWKLFLFPILFYCSFSFQCNAKNTHILRT